MKKIKFMQNAATFTSDLKVSEIEVLKRQNPMALALTEPNGCGGEDVIFNIDYANAAYGEISDSRVLFVGKDAEGYAVTTVLIPANLADRSAYLFDKFANACNFLKTVERNAKKALTNLSTSKEDFAKNFIDLDTEVTVSEALEEVDIIVKAESACECKDGACEVKKGGKAQ